MKHSIMTLEGAQCYAEYPVHFIVTLRVIMPSVVMLNVVMLNVIMLNVMMLSIVMLSVVAA
jgi:hypothetical protein